MQKPYLIAASLAGLAGVALGAFGAHGLKPLLNADELHRWETGVQYQMYHAVALLGCAFFLKNEYSTVIRNAARLFIAGIICFSGSLYLLATLRYNHISTSIIGPITPIGGLFFMAGWGLILYYAIRKN